MEAGGEQGGARGPYLTKIWERPGPRARHAAPHRSPVGRRGETSTISSWRAAVPRGTRPEDARSCGGASRVAGRAPRLLSTPPRPVTPPRTDPRSDGAGGRPPSAPGVLLCLEGLVAATARRRAALGPLYAGGRPSRRRPTASRTPQLSPPAPILWYDGMIPLAREPPRPAEGAWLCRAGRLPPSLPLFLFLDPSAEPGQPAGGPNGLEAHVAPAAVEDRAPRLRARPRASGPPPGPREGAEDAGRGEATFPRRGGREPHDRTPLRPPPRGVD